MVGLQYEDTIERARNDGIDDIGLARDGEAHLQEIRRVVEVVPRIDERLPDEYL